MTKTSTAPQTETYTLTTTVEIGDAYFTPLVSVGLTADEVAKIKSMDGDLYPAGSTVLHAVTRD